MLRSQSFDELRRHVDPRDLARADGLEGTPELPES